jgi:hypothetical protein
MKTKVITIGNIKPNHIFPKLMESDNGIVLFTDNKSGTAVHIKNSSYSLGDVSSTWYIDNFTDFKGKLELSND